jgi:U3 small nucleolar RNA-associated protein 8
VIWQHSISPGTIVTAVCKSSDGHGVCFGSKEKKKFFVNVVREDDKVIQVPVSHEVSGLKISSDGKLIFVILENSYVKCISTGAEDQTVIWTVTGKSSRSVVFSEFIEDIENGPEHGAVLIVSKRVVGKRMAFEVKVVALGEDRGSELVSDDVEIREDGEELGVFAYGDDTLYRWIPSSRIVEGRNIFAQMSWRFNIPQQSTFDGDSIVALGSNKILLGGNKNLVLIDTQYQAILSHRTSGEKLNLVAYSASMKTIIALTKNSNSIWGVSVDSGKGTLLEAIGKGYSEPTSRFDLGYSQVLVKKGYGVREYGNVLRDIIETSRESNEAIIEDLKVLKTQGKHDEFSRRLIAYLKGGEWGDDAKIEFDEEPIYDADHDRDVDQDLVADIANLFFVVESDATRIGEFVPEHALVYLLTHPLFPTTELPDLLISLQRHPRLLRQAIVTAPALPCRSLVDALSNEDDEIFNDVVSRLIEEFPSEMTLQALRESKTVDIPSVTDRVIRLDAGWGLMSVLVDAGGLFAWKGDILARLHEAVDTQINSLESSSEIMILIEETMRKLASTGVAAPDVSKISKRQLKKMSKKSGSVSNTRSKSGPELLSAEQREQERLKGVLKFGIGDERDANAKTKKDRLKQAHAVDRRVPAYSVERLIL